MNKEEQFVINGIEKILNKLVVARDSDDASAYNTLVNSLSEYFKTIWNQPKRLLSVEDTITYCNLICSIEKEMRKLEKVIDNALEIENFKYHYKWLLSYQRLDKEKKDLDNYVSWSDREKNIKENINKK